MLTGDGVGVPVVSQFTEDWELLGEPETVAAWTQPASHPWAGGVVRLAGLVPPGYAAWVRVANTHDPQEHPPEGSLDPRRAALLAAVLRAHTQSDELMAAVWEGFGDLPVTSAGLLDHHDGFRRYVVLRGGVDAIDRPLWRNQFGHAFYQSPQLWWPQDRAWCVVTEIDLPASYVGGTAACVADLLAHPELGARPASLDDRVDEEPEGASS